MISLRTHIRFDAVELHKDVATEGDLAWVAGG